MNQAEKITETINRLFFTCQMQAATEYKSGEIALNDDTTTIGENDKWVAGSENGGAITYSNLAINGKNSWGGVHANGHYLTLLGEIDASGSELKPRQL